MYDPNEPYQDELDELLDQVDALLLQDSPTIPNDDFDPDDYAPADHYDEPVVIHNYSNRYGAAPESREPEAPVIRAYNADYRRPEMRQNQRQNFDQTQVIRSGQRPDPDQTQVIRYPGELPRNVRNTTPMDPIPEEPPKKQKKRRKHGCLGCGCMTLLTMVGVIVLCVVLGFSWLFAPPKSDQSIGARKKDTAAVLICGTDKDGTRTDTMMLLYMSGSDKQVGLLSLPRDTYTITAAGNGAKLNSAYGRNGTGEEGMEGLLDYVQEIIGYRPDGYVLVDMGLVPRIVDLMGGLDVHLEHHIRVHTDGNEVYIPEGDHHLNGEEVLATLRYRYGYATADLGRVEVQRMVINECMKQWISPAKLTLLPDALRLIGEESLTNLNVRNFLWMGKTILLNRDSLSSDTLPGYATYIGDVSYYVLYRQDVADLINDRYNPYRETILAENLKIAG